MELDERNFSNKALEDFDLLDRAVAGDQKAYTTLMNRYRRSLYHTMLKMVRQVDDAEDLTIEAFAKAFKNLHKFKRDYTFSTWLFRIATNNAIDFIRRKKLETYSYNAESSNMEGDTMSMAIKDHGLTPQEETIRAEKIKLVREFVNQLPPRYQRLVKLRYFDELSYEEIATELSAPLGTVKAQLHRARELLYDIIKDRKESI